MPQHIQIEIQVDVFDCYLHLMRPIGTRTHTEMLRNRPLDLLCVAMHTISLSCSFAQHSVYAIDMIQDTFNIQQRTKLSMFVRAARQLSGDFQWCQLPFVHLVVQSSIPPPPTWTAISICIRLFVIVFIIALQFIVDGAAALYPRNNELQIKRFALAFPIILKIYTYIWKHLRHHQLHSFPLTARESS